MQKTQLIDEPFELCTWWPNSEHRGCHVFHPADTNNKLAACKPHRTWSEFLSGAVGTWPPWPASVKIAMTSRFETLLLQIISIFLNLRLRQSKCGGQGALWLGAKLTDRLGSKKYRTGRRTQRLGWGCPRIIGTRDQCWKCPVMSMKSASRLPKTNSLKKIRKV